MGVLQRFERRLEGLVNGAFAKAFKSEVQPVEIASALQRECDDRAAPVSQGRVMVPNDFTVELGAHDYERLATYAGPLSAELAELLQDHGREQRYMFVGPVEVKFERVQDLTTGMFRIRSQALAGVVQMPGYPPQAPGYGAPQPPQPGYPPMGAEVPPAVPPQQPGFGAPQPGFGAPAGPGYPPRSSSRRPAPAPAGSRSTGCATRSPARSPASAAAPTSTCASTIRQSPGDTPRSESEYPRSSRISARPTESWWTTSMCARPNFATAPSSTSATPRSSSGRKPAEPSRRTRAMRPTPCPSAAAALAARSTGA